MCICAHIQKDSRIKRASIKKWVRRRPNAHPSLFMCSLVAVFCRRGENYKEGGRQGRKGENDKMNERWERGALDGWDRKGQKHIFWCAPLKYSSLQAGATKEKQNSPTPTHTPTNTGTAAFNRGRCETIYSSPQRLTWHLKAYSERDGGWGRLTGKAKREEVQHFGFFLAPSAEHSPGWRKTL